MPANKLVSGIVALSVSKNWDEAKLEWDILDISRQAKPATCLCGHTPIFEVCTLKNKGNQCTAIVGNCCVKKFMGLPSQKIFQAIARVEKDWWRTLNAETIDFVYQKGWITESERVLYLDAIHKRLDHLSKEQNIFRWEIHKKILSRFIRRDAEKG